MFPSEWNNTDYYSTLGVERGATSDEIKSEYRWLAKKFHPDFNPEDSKAHDRFLKIQQAYETLSDPEKRNHYDLFLKTHRDSGAQLDDGSSFGNQASKSPPLVTPYAQRDRRQIWAGAAALLIFLFMVFAIGVGATSDSPPPQAVTTSETRSSPSPPAVAPSRYTKEDIEACQNYAEWRVDFGGVGSPTTNEGLRSALNRMELDISSSFYLADDYELIQLSNAAKRAAGFSAAMVGTTDEAIWAMATTGFEDALGRLSAVCGTVR